MSNGVDQMRNEGEIKMRGKKKKKLVKEMSVEMRGRKGF